MITSRSNPKIKQLIQLQKPRERRLQGLVLIEGLREIGRAQASGWRFTELFVCHELVKPSDQEFVKKLIATCKTEFISLALYEMLAYREHSDGVLALAKMPELDLNTLHLSQNPLIIVLESVEKPGNLGAIMRTADAAGVDAVLVCDPATDLYNPNTIRSSVGCIFTVPVRACTSKEAYEWLIHHKINIIATSLETSDHYLDADYTGRIAIVLGTEADGLSPYWTHNAHKRIRIPMRGVADSLNVSVTAAIVTFEALRQRDLAEKAPL